MVARVRIQPRALVVLVCLATLAGCAASTPAPTYDWHGLGQRDGFARAKTVTPRRPASRARAPRQFVLGDAPARDESPGGAGDDGGFDDDAFALDDDEGEAPLGSIDDDDDDDDDDGNGDDGSPEPGETTGGGDDDESPSADD